MVIKSGLPNEVSVGNSFRFTWSQFPFYLELGQKRTEEKCVCTSDISQTLCQQDIKMIILMYFHIKISCRSNEIYVVLICAQ